MNARRSVRIKVRGRLSNRLAAAFEGLNLVRSTGATELVGEVADQAELHAVLARIRDLGLELQSVAVATSGPAGQRKHFQATLDHLINPGRGSS